jgi:hypothetical protein
MIEPLTDMPPGTLGFRASGRIERDDYTNVLVPELHKAFEAGGKIRALYVIDNLATIEPTALWEDMKVEFGLGIRHHDQWERSAIVTDIDWMAHAARLFLWMIPGEARVFPTAELEAAKSWVGGGAA